MNVNIYQLVTIAFLVIVTMLINRLYGRDRIEEDYASTCSLCGRGIFAGKEVALEGYPRYTFCSRRCAVESSRIGL